MADIALEWQAEGFADISVGAADLETDEGLEAALLVSLFTDRRVAANEELPPGETTRRGWWGDSFAAVEGDRIGSRLWLLNREKVLPEVVAKAREYAREAVQWLIEDRVATRVDVTAEINAQDRGRIDLAVLTYRPDGRQASHRFAYNWRAQAAKTV